MRISAGLASLILVAACSSTPGSDNGAADGFAAAALSWEGARLGDMQAAWGNPTTVIRENADNSSVVAWTATHKRGRSYDYDPIPSKDFRCTVTVSTSTDQVITNVDLNHSKYCSEWYAPRLPLLTRSQ